MAFKTVTSYNEEKNKDFFLLKNDGDSADVIFLYRSEDDVLVADTHYIKSADYSGYVHCCGHDCPACRKGIRVQTKLFIPVYDVKQNKIKFFDRNIRFEPQLQKEVFSAYANPSEYVFRITRNGEAGSIDTTYSIVAIGKNNMKSYDQILAEHKISMPEHYEVVCKDLSSEELNLMLNNSGGNPNEDYSPTPRATVNAEEPVVEDVPTPTVETPNNFVPPEEAPVMAPQETTESVSESEPLEEPEF